MKILIENGAYQLLNVGDMSMLRVAVERIKEKFPSASISVITSSANRLLERFPEVKAIPKSGRDAWLSPIFSNYLKGSFLHQKAADLEQNIRERRPGLLKKIIELKLLVSGKQEIIKDLNIFLTEFWSADWAIATGGGYINDFFKYDSLRILTILEILARLGKPVFLVGQGLGPISDEQLKIKVEQVFNVVNLISVREHRIAPPLLNSLGVPENRVFVTGDDAVELAYRSSPKHVGNAIGINLRMAPYSGIDEDIVEKVRRSVQSAADRHHAPLVPIPIERAYFKGSVDPDSATIKNLLKGVDDESDGGLSLNTPVKVIQQASQCRVVVTGSYHAGVFALSQGIPVVGLAKSVYYADKFLGLVNQFGIGCEVLMLNSEHLVQELTDKIDYLWQNSPNMRSNLLIEAEAQINRGHCFYEKLFEIVENRLN